MTNKSEPIPCEFIKIRKSSFSSDEGRIHLKHGRYHNSVFPAVKDYGEKQWVIGGYLKLNEGFEKYKDLKESEIIDRCIEFLNVVPRGKRKPIYGLLKPIRASHKGPNEYETTFRENDIIVLFSTDDRRCKLFWSEGEVVGLKLDGRSSKAKK